MRRATRGSEVPQTVAEHVHRQHGDRQEQPREQDNPRRDLEVGPPLRHHVAPARDLRRRAGAEEAQDRLHHHRGRADIGRLHDQGRERVRHHMQEQDARQRHADGDRRLDIGLLPDREHDGADQSHDARDLRDGDGDDDVGDRRAGERDQRDRQQHARDRHQPVHDTHDQRVHPADVAGKNADEETDDRRHQGDEQPDRQRDPPACQGAREHVAAVHVRAEGARVSGRLQPVDRVERQRVRREQRPQ